MPNPFDEAFTAQNPIVAAAQKIRARRDVETAIDSATPARPHEFEDAADALRAFAGDLQTGVKRLNAILGKNGVTFVQLERPLRIRLRFREVRVSLDLDDLNQLVRVTGAAELDGDYQFDPQAATPSMINLSHLSTEAGYGTALTASLLLKTVARDAELPPPDILGRGPLQF